MLSYEVLCQHIADWKAGQRPTSAPRPVPRAAPAEVHELDSGMVTLDDADPYADEGDAQVAAESGATQPTAPAEPEAASVPVDDEDEIPIDG